MAIKRILFQKCRQLLRVTDSQQCLCLRCTDLRSEITLVLICTFSKTWLFILSWYTLSDLCVAACFFCFLKLQPAFWKTQVRPHQLVSKSCWEHLCFWDNVVELVLLFSSLPALGSCRPRTPVLVPAWSRGHMGHALLDTPLLEITHTQRQGMCVNTVLVDGEIRPCGSRLTQRTLCLSVEVWRVQAVMSNVTWGYCRALGLCWLGVDAPHCLSLASNFLGFIFSTGN